MPVRAIVRDASKGKELKEIGCELVVADLHDSASLETAFSGVDAVQIIIPPSPRAEDPAAEMRSGIEALARAVEKAKPKKTLIISDYGAHIEKDIGMPTMCRSFEERLRKVAGHKVFLRSAEHMQGWARAIPAALQSGTLMSFHDPVDMAFPTISAPDLGDISAHIFLGPTDDEKVEIVHAEGPQRDSATGVAAVLTDLVGHKISVEPVPRSQWKEAFERGMSPTMADLLIQANDAQNKGGLVDVESDASDIRHGTTGLMDAHRPLILKQ